MASATQATPVRETVRETKPQAEQVAEASNVSATVPLTVKIDRDAYKYVAANLVKEEVALFGAAKAMQLVPDKMNRLINDFIKSRATQLAKQASKRAIELQFKDVIEENARGILLKVHNSNNE